MKNTLDIGNAILIISGVLTGCLGLGVLIAGFYFPQYLPRWVLGDSGWILMMFTFWIGVVTLASRMPEIGKGNLETLDMVWIGFVPCGFSIYGVRAFMPAILKTAYTSPTQSLSQLALVVAIVIFGVPLVKVGRFLMAKWRRRQQDDDTFDVEIKKIIERSK